MRKTAMLLLFSIVATAAFAAEIDQSCRKRCKDRAYSDQFCDYVCTITP